MYKLLFALFLPLSATAATAVAPSDATLAAIGRPSPLVEYARIDESLGRDPFTQPNAGESDRHRQWQAALGCAEQRDWACALDGWLAMAQAAPARWQPEAYAIALWSAGHKDAAIAWYDHAAAVFPLLAEASYIESRRSTFALGHIEAKLFAAWRDQRAPLRKTITVAVGIDPEGRPERVQVLDKKLSPALAARVQQAVADWQFAPASIDGVPARRDTFVYVDVRGRPAGDSQMQFDLVYTGSGARVDKQYAPVFPRTFLMNRGTGGSVLLHVDYDTDGKVTDVQAVDVDGAPALVEASLKALRRWRFAPEHIDGIAQAGDVLVPVLFTIERDSTRPLATMRRSRDRVDVSAPVF